MAGAATGRYISRSPFCHPETTMPIPVFCESCRQTHLSADNMAGRRTRCRKCGATLTVPNYALGPARVEPEPVKRMETSNSDVEFRDIEAALGQLNVNQVEPSALRPRS